MRRNIQSCCRLAIVVCLFPLLAISCADPSAKSQKSGTTASGTVTGESTKRGDAKLAALNAEFLKMSEVLQFDNENQTRMQKIHDQQIAKMKKWYAENGDSIVEIQGNAMKAFKNKDQRKLNEMNSRGDKQKIAKLIAQERGLSTQYKAALLAALPEPSKIIWQAHVVSENLLEFLRPLELSEKQIEEVRARGSVAIGQLKTSVNWEGQGTAGLEKLFERQVLTPEQKSAFVELKSKNRMRMLKWNSN